MDFVELANELPKVTQTLLRHLTVGSSTDDFARLDGEYEQSREAGHQQQPIDGSGYDYYYTPEEISTVSSHPFLSKTAEAELYLLATNFLLCKYGAVQFWNEPTERRVAIACHWDYFYRPTNINPVFLLPFHYNRCCHGHYYDNCS